MLFSQQFGQRVGVEPSLFGGPGNLIPPPSFSMPQNFMNIQRPDHLGNPFGGYLGNPLDQDPSSVFRGFVGGIDPSEVPENILHQLLPNSAAMKFLSESSEEDIIMRD